MSRVSFSRKTRCWALFLCEKFGKSSKVPVFYPSAANWMRSGSQSQSVASPFHTFSATFTGKFRCLTTKSCSNVRLVKLVGEAAWVLNLCVSRSGSHCLSDENYWSMSTSLQTYLVTGKHSQLVLSTSPTRNSRSVSRLLKRLAVSYSNCFSLLKRLAASFGPIALQNCVRGTFLFQHDVSVH